ncbi:MAG: O-antigen ligase family protein [Anaerolineae bacterium]|nr:O-antigen ligase family protein [Anaerolineae bacterium]
MVNAYLMRLQAAMFGPDRRKARRTVWGLCLAAAFVVAAYVAALGPLYALAGVIAVIGGALMITSVQWGLYALVGIICILPFATFPFKIGFTPTFLDVALMALFFVWLARLAAGRERELETSSIGMAVLLFLGLALVAFARGLTYTRLTMTVLRHFVEIILGIAVFFLVINNVRDLAQIEDVMRVLILAGLGAAAIGVILYVIPEAWTVRILNALGRFGYPGGYGALRYIEDNPANPMRAIGTSVDPNVLGGLMILVTAATAPQIAERKPVLPRWLIAAALATEALCLYLTYSRGSLVGLAAALFLLGIVRYRRLLVLGLIGGGLLLLLPQAHTYVSHFLAGIRGQDRATQMRFGEYKDALRLISDYPWFGVGFVGAPRIDLYIGVSNLYLLIAEETGLIGLAAFLLTMLSFFWHLVASWRQGLSERAKGIALGLGGAVFGGLVGGIFDHYLFNLTYPHMTSLFWLYIGLTVATLRAGAMERTDDLSASSLSDSGAAA